MSFFSWLCEAFFGRAKSPPRPGALQPADADAFVTLAVKSGLCTAPALCDALNAFRRELQASWENCRAELNAFCDHLVKNGVLTRWQSDKLLQGRHKGFFLNHFKLLYRVGCEETCSKYAAEDLRTKRRVVLRVLPRAIKKRENGDPYYEVDETTDPG